MKDTDFLFETSSKYRVLLNRINDNIAQESDYINSKEFHLACNTGLIVWSDLKKFMRLVDAENFLEIEHERVDDSKYILDRLKDVKEETAAVSF